MIRGIAQGGTGGDGFNFHIPGVPLPDITPETIGAFLAILAVTAFIIKGWKIISGHPWILIVLVVVGLAAVGFISLHIPGSRLH